MTRTMYQFAVLSVLSRLFALACELIRGARRGKTMKASISRCSLLPSSRTSAFPSPIFEETEEHLLARSITTICRYRTPALDLSLATKLARDSYRSAPLRSRP
ncbi:hypothetical protein K474DRAFT_1664000 [Panus rudis PR-1116 ss-1]|nr:hypothetical protein K474DRAFT_1664000 [Panus rudis PR-1116 ss-1]